jgi:nucleotide-binding universal stress UspA family protein
MTQSQESRAPERILVGIDEHEASTRAFEWVVERARSGLLQVTLLTVMNGMRVDPLHADARLGRLERQLLDTSPGIEVRVDTRYGEPVAVLVEAARLMDILVIGSRRDHPLRSALDGWLPERIPTRSTVPTVVVPSDWEHGRGAVVLGVGDETDRGAIAFAAQEASRAHQDLVLVRIWNAPVSSTTSRLTVLEDPSWHEDHNRRIVDDAMRMVGVRFPEQPCGSMLLEGEPGEVLTAQSGSSSLLVLGRAHRSTLGGAITGSVARQVIGSSRTPVCVVPPRVPAGPSALSASNPGS